MKTKKIFTFSAIALVAGLVLTGCVQPAEENPVTNPTSSPTTTAPTVVPDSSKPPTQIDLQDSSSELTQAQLLFPTANATSSFTKEEVQLALFSASRYFNTALTNPYFLNGDYEAANYPTDKLQSILQPYFSNSALLDLVTKTSDPNAILDSGQKAAPQWALSAVYFPLFNGEDRTLFLPEACLNQQTTPNLPEGENYQGTPGTGSEQVEETNASFPCTTGPAVFAKIDYEERLNDTGETVLTIRSTGTIDEIIINDGKNGTRAVTYNFVVDMSKNEYADWKNGVHSMVVNKLYDPTASWAAWQAE